MDDLPLEGIHNFGIDYGGPSPNETNTTVEVPEIEVPDEFNLQRLQQEIVPLLIRSNEDPVDMYLFTKSILLSEV